ncbi:MAG: TPM domain-containing protein [Candidatus Omnitrophica bacterium]|nr:TPM domain-containing protein [Candidatus Omnitrophota bacterium]
MNFNRRHFPKHFFSRSEEHLVFRAIKSVELRTSAEIRVHLDEKITKDVLEHAQEIFQKLGMTKTKDRNGVLIFLALKNRKFAILGDEGIHKKVPESFWTEISEQMTRSFREDRFAEGIVQAIERAGEKLHQYFPAQSDDENELSDQITIS